MVVFTRKYPLQRLLKKRTFKYNKSPRLRFGTVGIYCLHTFRFEYRYCLFFRKFFKAIFRRRKRKIVTVYRRKTWLFIRPNYVLTHKSKNARMGKGKGNFKRWCTIVYPGRVFIEHLNVSPNIYKQYLKKLKYKLKIQLKLVLAKNSTLKSQNINSNVVSYIDQFDFIRIRTALYK